MKMNGIKGSNVTVKSMSFFSSGRPIAADFASIAKKEEIKPEVEKERVEIQVQHGEDERTDPDCEENMQSIEECSMETQDKISAFMDKSAEQVLTENENDVMQEQIECYESDESIKALETIYSYYINL